MRRKGPVDKIRKREEARKQLAGRGARAFKEKEGAVRYP